jgi:hypothetical protein
LALVAFFPCPSSILVHPRTGRFIFLSLPRYFDLIQMAWTLLETEILASVNQGPARFGAGLSIINQTAILFAGLGQVFFLTILKKSGLGLQGR